MTREIHPNLLIADSDPATTRDVLEVVAARGIRGTVAEDPRAAHEHLSEMEWDLVLLDIDTVGDAVFKLLDEVKTSNPEVPVIVLTPDESVSRAVRALKQGADELLVKPFQGDQLEGVLDELLPNHDVSTVAAAEDGSQCLYQIVGTSRSLERTIEMARRVAPTSAPVLICGESGTGKELLSYVVHRHSRRSRGPYIRVNCAAISESLLESELFGHERGAFTGACNQRKGRFELAHGGTLLLDEISETGPRLQAELLRVLEQQDFLRVGGTQDISVNVRVIATTNRDLLAEVEEGNFRSDLYYRLSGVRLVVPPLRERIDDIPELVWHFVNQYAREVRRRIRRLDDEMLEIFERCGWPGNVRQLRNAVRTALILGEGDVLSLAGAPQLREELTGRCESEEGSIQTLKEMERRAIIEALCKTKSHQAKAARLLGITDRTLREKLRRYREDGKPLPAEVA
jgi:two-component system response regulator HydG